MIKTVIFDLSEVYLQGVTGISNQLKELLGKDLTDSKLLRSELNQLFLGQITEEYYWQRVIEKNAWNISPKQLIEAARKNFKEIKGIRKIIESLKKKGYKLGLLSNHAREWVQFCESKFNYRELFNVITYSFEAQASKPDKEAFLFILKKLNSKPENTLFIDDYLKNDSAAKELGLQAIQFTSPSELRLKLKELGIKI